MNFPGSSHNTRRCGCKRQRRLCHILHLHQRSLQSKPWFLQSQYKSWDHRSLPIVKSEGYMRLLAFRIATKTGTIKYLPCRMTKTNGDTEQYFTQIYKGLLKFYVRSTQFFINGYLIGGCFSSCLGYARTSWDFRFWITYETRSLFTRIITDTNVQLTHPDPVFLTILVTDHVHWGKLEDVRGGIT